MTDTQSRLGKIEGKLDTLLEFYAEDRKRLAAVEKRVWWTSGAAAVIGIIIGPMLKKLGLVA